MKKILALVLCAVMVLSMIPALALSSSAAVEGEWITRRRPADYGKDTYTPAPGYYYDATGFHCKPASYKDTAPFFRVTSKNTYNLKEGFKMTLRMDEFCYKGEDGQADEWIAFTLFTTMDQEPAYREVGSGNGWVSLVRGTGNGSATFQSFLQSEDIVLEDGSKSAGHFDHTGDVGINCDFDGDCELYEFEVSYDGSYHIFINGVECAGQSSVSAWLDKYLDDGNAYVGISFHSTVPDGDASCSILSVNGAVPAGDDSAEPDENLNYKAPIADSSTIPEGQPCLLWDANHLITNGDPAVANCVMTPQGDGSYSVKADVSNSVYFSFGPKGELSYEAQDFPVIAMMMKDYWGNDGTYYYCGGKVTGAQDNCTVSWSMSDDNAAFYGDEEEYVFVCVDLAGYENYVGRINGVRVVFGIDCQDPDANAWYMNWVGFFRTVDDAKAYADAWMAAINPGSDATEPEAGDDATEPEAGDDATEAPAADTEAPAADTEAPATEAPAADATEAPAADATEAPAADGTDAPEADEGGCASVIGCVAIIMTAIAAAFVCKKH